MNILVSYIFTVRMKSLHFFFYKGNAFVFTSTLDVGRWTFEVRISPPSPVHPTTPERPASADARRTKSRQRHH